MRSGDRVVLRGSSCAQGSDEEIADGTLMGSLAAAGQLALELALPLPLPLARPLGFFREPDSWVGREFCGTG